MLVNPFGPVHVKFGTPLPVLVAFNIRSKPLHIGELANAIGEGGGFGSAKVNGPAMFDEQPLSTTKILEYTHCESRSIVILPETAVTVCSTGEPPFFT